MHADKPTVVILCGGRGTRLHEHASSLPKPLVEILFQQRKVTSLAADINFYAAKTHYALGAARFEFLTR